MNDTCDIDSTVLPNIYNNYTACMDVCDKPQQPPTTVENKYNECHQGCCDKNFANYNTIKDTCDIEATSILYDDYTGCMTVCDKPEPTLYDNAKDVVANITPNITIGSDKPNTTIIKMSDGNKSANATNTGTSGGAPLCAPALAFLVMIGLYGKR